MKELKFFLVTDTHYFKNSIGAYGEDYERFMDYEQKCFAETQSINEAAFAYLEKSDEADIILIAGDLTFNGEKESHKAFSALLHDFKERTGKKIFVVTAGHDSNKNPFGYNETGRIAVEGTAFEELYDYYREFGYDQAIEFDREHMSYVAELSDDVRLLVICNDTAEGNNKEYSEEFLSWINAQANKAQADGKMMIAMEHYPVLAGQPILNIIPDARQKSSKKLIETLADNGVHLIFTGHMHNQSINAVRTKKGNKFVDVCTGSLIGCPAFMRLITIKDESTVDIKSIPIPEFEWDKGGKTGEQYLREQFEKMLRSCINALEKNPEKLCEKLCVKYNPAIKKPAAFLGRKISTVTLGTVGKLLFVKVDDSIKNEKFFDFIVDAVRSVFTGNQPFVEGTPKGDALLSFFKKAKPFVKTLKGSQGETFDFYNTMKHTVGNYGTDDYNAEIKLK